MAMRWNASRHHLVREKGEIKTGKGYLVQLPDMPMPEPGIPPF
jgi:hypothetical protein